LKLDIRVGFSSYQRVISALVLPGGYRNNDGSFNNIRNNAFFWSATENDNNNAWLRNLNNNNGYVSRNNNINNNNKSSGASVRCLRDLFTSKEAVGTTDSLYF
jgi:uncharacterized protein (TIGR02145 family)